MAKLKAGDVVTLPVERHSPFGYFLSDGQQDVLLHASESKEEIQLGTMLQVFLYHDHEDRLAATLSKPILTAGDRGFLTVADVNPTLGLFLENGTPRNVLLPKNDLPDIQQRWPQENDRVYVYIGRDKQERMLADLLGEEELAEISVKAEGLKVNDKVDVTLTQVIDIGAFFITADNVMGMIHSSEQTRPLRVGETLNVRITFVREDGRINASMRLPKEESRDEDADKLYQYIVNHGGAMPYSDKSTPEVIEARFGISKAAFKRALGKLMKARLVYQEDGETRLVEGQE